MIVFWNRRGFMHQARERGYLFKAQHGIVHYDGKKFGKVVDFYGTRRRKLIADHCRRNSGKNQR